MPSLRKTGTLLNAPFEEWKLISVTKIKWNSTSPLEYTNGIVHHLRSSPSFSDWLKKVKGFIFQKRAV